MKAAKWIGMMSIVVGCGLAACHDDEKESPKTDGFSVSAESMTIGVGGRYYTVEASGFEEGRTVAVSTEGWLRMSVDTIASDGCVEFYVEANEVGKGRDGSIRFFTVGEGGAKIELPVSISIHQTGMNEANDNSGETKYDRFRLGYGYNIFKEYMSDKSSTEAVIDCNGELAARLGLASVALGGNEEAENMTTNTKYEMAELFTMKEEKSSSAFGGSKNTTKRFDESGTVESGEVWYTYLKFRRTEASGSIDFAKVKYLGSGNDIRDLFTAGFRDTYDKLLKDASKDNVKAMLRRYGTHVVVSSDIGGAMDLTLNFKRSMKGDLKMRAEEFSNYFFDGDPLNGDLSDIATNITASADGNSAFTIVGGSKASREQIAGDVNGLQQVSSAHLLEWQKSLDINSTDEIVNSGCVAVHFQLVPIWQLFPQGLHSSILDGVMAMSQESPNNTVSDIESELDKYTIPLTKADYLEFAEGTDNTLVRVLYAASREGIAKEPIVEICNEYVPAVRADKRITVLYGCRNGRPFHGAGLFIGDGEGNPPAWLTFSDGLVYVKPIEGMGPYDKVDTIYFMHGNIYTSDLGIEPPVMKYYEVEDYWLKMMKNYPVVKIGDGYWTRKDLEEQLYFMDKYSRFTESMNNGVNYACTYYTNAMNRLSKKARDVFGYETTALYGSEVKTKWYLPSDDEIMDLYTYIGKNTKSLFSGKVSGFEAAFNGYYGSVDVLTGESLGSSKWQLKGEYCFFTSKDCDDSEKGIVLALSTDYKLTKHSGSRTAGNRFPVRLYRTSYYQYSKK